MTEQVGLRVVVLGVAQARSQIGSIRSDLTRFARELGTANTTLSKLGLGLNRTGDAMVSLGRSLTFGLTLPIVGAIGTLTKAGIDFETAFTGVTKTVDGLSTGFDELAISMYGTSKGLSDAQKAAVFANDAFGDLTKTGEEVRKTFIDMSLRIPIAATELARVGQISGQLGISASQIAGFTEIMAKLGVTTDLSAEDAAFAIARIANIMGVKSEDMSDYASRFGNAIVDLGNNVAATEPEITNLALRLASVGSVVGLTTPQILGISAALAEVGVKSERGGTAISRIFYEMISAVADGGDQLDLFAKIANKSSTEFATLFKKDAVGALQIFLTNLTRLQDEGKVSADTLTALGVEGVRVREIINILGPNFELVNESIGRANAQWSDQIALQEEFTKFSSTTSARLMIMRNAFTALGIAVTDAIRNDLNRFIDGLTNLFKVLSNLDPAILRWGVRLGGILALIGPLNIALGTLLQFSGNAILGFDKMYSIFGGLLKLPFSPFLAVLGALGLSGKKGGLFGGIFGGLGKPQSFSQDISGVLKFFTGLFSKITNPVGSLVSKLFSSAFTIAANTPGNIVKGMTKFLGNILKVLPLGPTGFGIISTVLQRFLAIFGSSVDFLSKTVLGSLGTGIQKVTGIFGTFISGALKRIPILGGTIVRWLLAPLKELPLILAAAGAAFTLLFAPKVISQFLKNKDKVFDEVKLSVKQFQDDMKSGGLQQAILLFFSGGSTGSGRPGGLLGIAKALGASEENAKKFSYAMGVASYWVTEIAKNTLAFVKRLLFGKDVAESISGTTKNTSKRLISLAAGIAKFFEGFFNGWTGSFDSIEAAFKGFTASVKENFGAVGRLFDTIFGGGKREAQNFIDSLEPGVENGATSFGETVGRVLGEFITLGLRGLQLIVEIATVVANAFTSIVTAYNQGGVKGVFEELGPILEGIWNGLIDAAAGLWKVVRPHLVTFATTVGNWFITDAPGLLSAGISSLGSTLVDSLWNDKTVTKTLETQMKIPILSPGKDNLTSVEFGTFTSVSQGEVLQEGLKSRLSTLLTKMKDFITGDGGAKLLSGLQSAFDTAWAWVKDVAWEEKGKPALESVWKGLVNFFNTTLAPGIETEGKKLALKFMAGLLGQIQNFTSVFKYVLPGFTGVFDIALKQLNDDLAKLDLNQVATDASQLQSTNIGYLAPPQRQAILARAEELGVTIGETTMEHIQRGFITQEDAAELELLLQLDQLETAARTQLEANSPSGVFMRIGQDIMNGLVYGLRSQQYSLQTTINAIISQLYGMSNSIATVSNIIRSQLQSIFSFAQSVLSMLSSTVSNALATLTGSIVNNTTTSNTSNVYNPQFIGPQPQQTYTQNSQLYSQYLLANQAVG